MTTTTEAVMRGIRHGFSMGLTPDSTRMWELAEEARSTEYTREAWIAVGTRLASAASPSETYPQTSSRSTSSR